MKNYLLLSLLLSASAYADVDPEYFCHDRQGFAPDEFHDAYSNIATFWKDRESFYELRIAGPDLAPGLEVPGKAKTRYVNSVVVAFHEKECLQNANGTRFCHRLAGEETAPIWIWGDNVDILAPSHPKSQESPLSYVRSGSIRALLSQTQTVLSFKTIEGDRYRIKVSCDAPSWEWYPHVPLDELETKVQ